ncbi:hypothetical protein E5K00_18455 [Hymenobacter aquaticus]|uniref:Uncharacterized protein n=1 Tax=Hymenobacter aquaticus TaxID=1867101 RepID=A0A4Z0PWT2_9BACT|nr:hypothetical protein [Hymenobacter aquaticus]TGE22230.1 hypothetical protein E5K00_18455 [Hymenobacter aquaticus]
MLDTSTTGSTPSAPAATPASVLPTATTPTATPAPDQPSATPPPSGLHTPTRPNFEQHELSNGLIQWLGPLSIGAVLALIILAENKLAGTQTAASIGFITAAALGIERVIEGIWNALSSRIGAYWPMTSISRQVHDLELQLADSLKPFHGHLDQALATAHSTEQAIPAYLTTAQQDLDSMQRRFNDIRAHGPSNQRMQLLAATAAQSVNFLVTKYQNELPRLREGVALADTAISGMQDFLATFKDNPGRRLLSLYLGALLGLALAAIFQLDVFAAINAMSDIHSTDPLPATPGLRIAATGLLIGLGSNPTHEVIQLLHEHKKGQKGKNTSNPQLKVH